MRPREAPAVVSEAEAPSKAQIVRGHDWRLGSAPVRAPSDHSVQRGALSIVPRHSDGFDTAEPRSLRRNAKGYPLSFVTEVDENGIEDPCSLDDNRVHFCYRHRLCGICGEPLPPGELMCFIGMSKNMKTRLFYDPPMHPACAHYATTVCPVLANLKWRPVGRQAHVGRPRPQAFYLDYTYSHKWERFRRPLRRGEHRKLAVCRAGDPIRIERRFDHAH